MAGRRGHVISSGIPSLKAKQPASRRKGTRGRNSPRPGTPTRGVFRSPKWSKTRLLGGRCPSPGDYVPGRGLRGERAVPEGANVAYALSVQDQVLGVVVGPARERRGKARARCHLGSP